MRSRCLFVSLSLLVLPGVDALVVEGHTDSVSLRTTGTMRNRRLYPFQFFETIYMDPRKLLFMIMV